MAGGAAGALVVELGALWRLSGPGAAQLAADLDYFCNVLAALGVALSPPLLTWQARAWAGCVGCIMGYNAGFRPCRRRCCLPGERAFLSRVTLHGRAEAQRAPPPALWRGGRLEPGGARPVCGALLAAPLHAAAALHAPLWQPSG